MEEVKTMMKFSHKNVCGVFDQGFEENCTIMLANGTQSTGTIVVLEYCGAGTLFDFVALTGAFSEELARHYFAQLCSGLYQLHG